MRRVALGAGLLGLCVLAVGLWQQVAPSSERPQRPLSTATPQPRQEGAQAPAFDVGAVIRQVHFAFRQEERGWSGGHSTYAVDASNEGLTLTPFHAPGEQGESKVQRGAPLLLGHARVTRGGVRLGDESGSTKVQKDGHLALEKGAVVEHLRNGEEGMEQSWAFAAPPPGEGALRVEVPVQGLAYAGSTASGLHFVDAKTGLGFRYGHGTWVDASGRRTSVEARWTGSAIALAVPAEVLSASAYPAVLDPIISPEREVDAPVIGPSITTQEYPAVATDGIGYLVTWQEVRRNDTDIYAARVGADGVVLDPTGVLVTSSVGMQSHPAVAFNGTDYLVAWADERNGDSDIYATRVTATGAVLDTAGIFISIAAGRQVSPAVVRHGAGFLVAWEDGRSGNADIYAARVNAAGGVLDPGGIAVSTAAGNQANPVAAHSGMDSLVVWEDGRNGPTDIYAARVGAAGEVLDVSGRAISTGWNDQLKPAVAFNGADYLVAWEDRRGGIVSGIYASRVSVTGGVLDSGGIALADAPNLQWAPAVTWDGTNFLIAWKGHRDRAYWDIYAARVNAAGVVLDPGGLAVTTTPQERSRPVLASNGTTTLLVWSQRRTGASWYNWYINAVRLGATGERLDTGVIDVSTTANTQLYPSVASNGTDYLVAWHDSRSGTRLSVYAARVSATGEVLDPSGLSVSTSDNYAFWPVVAVASNGADYLVVWDDFIGGNGIHAARVSSAGEVLDPIGIAVTTAAQSQFDPAVAFNGTDYLVTWSDQRNGSNWDIYGARVTTAGGVLDPQGIAIATTLKDELGSAVASNGTNSLVSWFEWTEDGGYGLYAARVGNAGQLLDSSSLALTAFGAPQTYPAVASDGTDYLVAWEDGRGGTTWDIYAARVSGAGVILDPGGFAVTKGAGLKSSVDVAPHANSYLVTWVDDRNPSNRDVYGTCVSAAGPVPVREGFVVSAEPEHEWRPELAAMGQGRFLVAYSRFDSSPEYGSERVRTRLITLTAPSVATSRSVSTQEDTALPFTLSAEDTQGSAPTFVVVEGPAHGTLECATTGECTYTPGPDYAGEDGFTFTASDGCDTSAPGTVSITVGAVNDAPVATDMAVEGEEGSDVQLTLAATDVEGDALTYAVATAPAHGTVTCTAAGACTYAPEAGFAGEDSFTFTASDGQDRSSPAVVSISVIQSQVPVDAGTDLPDAGTGAPDAGTGGPDAGSDAPDGGAGPGGDALGCGCNEGSGGGSLLLACLAFLPWMRRRRGWGTGQAA